MTRTRLTGAQVITMATDRPPVEAADIFIDGANIRRIGPGADDVRDGGEGETIDLTGKIVMPGLVNAHIHTWQSALRLVAADWSLPEYLARAHGDIAGAYTPEDMRIGTLLGALAQINAGITTIGDWSHNCTKYEHAAAAIEGLAHSGIRAAFLHGTPHGLRDRPHDTAMFDALAGGPIASSPLLTAGMAIKGPTLSSERNAIVDLTAARDRGVVATMHQSSGTPGQTWDAVTRHALWGPLVNIVHGTAVSDDLARLLIDHGVTFTATPENEQGQGHCTSVVDSVFRHGGSLSMGTDSDAFVSGDVRVAARMVLSRSRATEHQAHRVRTGSVVSALSTNQWDALSWITREGANALGLAGRTGVLAPGMAADLIVLDARDISTWPHHDALAVALHTHPGVVEAVMIGGTWRKRNGVIVDTDLAAIQDQAWQSGSRLVEHLNSTSLHRRVRRRVVQQVVQRSLSTPVKRES
ncbi:amidohydrolase family protein (plasmid) [Rhodococcoides fascians A21d2]|uniref:amidohydrolase family protein n=1 Tax=Rhodococcoides fascians TaxID=1828 RepID=UPI0005643746|nr:amidohydrolase family protein [Rhodococcus fascians]QII03687.1 amidohydrolase family protein [Rhodococcus fascians A21d2]